MLCYDYFYGLDMPLLAMEVMNNGLSGVAAWMLDDAMHSNGDSGRTEDVKIWGMWNILGEEVFGDASQEELRPWYYTWSLMCRHFPAGCDVLACEVPQREGLRVAAARKDAAYSVAAVNFSETLPEAFFTVIRRATGRATQTDFPRRANAALRGSVSARRFPPKVSFC